MAGWQNWKRRLRSVDAIFLYVALLIPLLDQILPPALRLADVIRPIFVFAILGLGLNIVTGFTGLLNLGCAAFMAIGAYAYAILTCEVYPYRLGFWPALAAACAIGAISGVLLGAPTLRLRGDYIAIVTLGFCEIVQDTIRNLDSITNGTQGINPLPPPHIFKWTFTPDELRPEFYFANYLLPGYYLILALLALCVWFCRNLERSRIGRSWVAIREDELAATCMGINPVKTKLLAFATGAAMCALAGAIWVSSLGSSGEPGNYDFMISITALCIVIVGGMGNISGVLLGALVMMGIDSIFLTKLLDYMARRGLVDTGSIFATPSSWKFMLFGLMLVLMMRFKPEGFLPSRRVKGEMHPEAAG